MSEIKTGEEEKPPSSDKDNDPTSDSLLEKDTPNPKRTKILIDEKSDINNQNNNSGIVEVFKDNLNIEMKKLISLSNEYNYIGMDTEFPGIVFSLTTITDDFYYKTLKLNVESLKLIQLGITLSNSKGETPQPYHTWQFNFEFDFLKDKYSESSINLLISSGISFTNLKKNGINHKKFFKIFKNSGLVLNPKIHWVSFHGSYDFAYLLNNLMGNTLPPNENEFMDILGAFFPNHYDIKILVKEKYNLQGSLNKLAWYLGVIREGKMHQAGSDSLVTINVFWKLIKNGFISLEELIENKNILFGILQGKDNEETINYTKINYGGKNYNNVVQKYNGNKYLYLPYACNMNINFYYPQYIMNGMNNGICNIQVLKNKNNLLLYG